MSGPICLEPIPLHERVCWKQGDWRFTGAEVAGVSSAFMGAPQHTREEILDQIRQLSEQERRWLVAELQADHDLPPSEDRRRAAMKRWLARAGSGHADAADVSSRKSHYGGS